MLNELITWVLNTYLGKYLEDFNPAQLSVALLSGEVELENVPIRKNAFHSFKMPIQANSGNIGKIKLQIPVRQFRTAPWCIIIERVYLVFGPKNLDEWDDEKEKLADLDHKLGDLDSSEAKWRVERGMQTANFYSNSYISWLNYGTTLATNILENLELKINDVHIRYEDTITIKNVKFSAGIKISSLTIQSCDSSWIPGANLSSNQNISYKLIELKDLSVYWDKLKEENRCSNLKSKDLLVNMEKFYNANEHNFIISPICARTQFKRERCKQAIRTKSRPRLSCEILIQEVKISISDFQYKQIIDCATGLHQISRISAYRIRKPHCSVTGNAKLWWRYAASCYGFRYHTREEYLTKIKENLRYIKIYKLLLLNPNDIISTDDKQFKLHIEKSRSLNNLRILRNICFSNIVTKEVSLKTRNNQGRSMLFHWFPNWWGWYGNSDTTNPSQEQEEMKNIENDILNALEDTMENESFSKRDALFAYFKFILEDGRFILNTADNSSKSTPITKIEMDFQNLISFIEIKPKFSSYLVGVSLGSVCLKDKLTEGTEFSCLIKPQSIETQISSQSLTIKTHNVYELEPWFQLQYEKAPLDMHCDFKLIIKSKSLDIVFNKSVFDWLISFFIIPLNKLNSKSKTYERKKNRLKFLKNWRSFLLKYEEHRKIWSFEIDISAPRIIFIENFLDKNTSIVLVDFGRFQLLKSDIPKKESNVVKIDLTETVGDNDKVEKGGEDDDLFMTPCSTPPGSQISFSESPTICQDTSNTDKYFINNDTGLEKAFHNKIYDKYLINLTDLQIITCKNRERVYASFKNSSNFHVLDKFNITLELERRVIFTTDPEYPSLTLFGTLPKIVAHVNEQKVNEIFKIMYPLSQNKYQHKDDSNYIEEENMETVQIDQDLEEDISNTNLVIIQFVIGQMILEVQSCEKSIAELQIIGARAGVTKRAKDIQISMSVHGLLLVDAIQSFGPDFELLVASHRHVGMDSISGSLKQSEPCSPVSPESPDPTVNQRPTSPYVINKVISNLHTDSNYNNLDFDEMNALIIIDINFIEATTEENSLLVANITFNNLDIIANQETVVELFGFLDRVVYAPKAYYTPNQNEQFQRDKNDIEFENSLQPLRTEVTFDFHRLNILVFRSMKKENVFIARKVGTLTMSEAKIHATLGKETNVNGSLGGVQIIDVTAEGINHQRIFSVGKDPITDPPDLHGNKLLSTLTSEMYGNNEDAFCNQINALSFQINRNQNSIVAVKVRMASVWYTHCPRFLQEMNLCVSQFKHYLKNFFTSVRNKATNIAKEFVQQINIDEGILPQNKKLNTNSQQISMDFVLNTPVLVLPRSSQTSEVFVANLGKIKIYNSNENNEFLSLENEPTATKINVSTMNIDIRNINLYSLDTYKRKDFRIAALPKANELYSCKDDALPILHDTAMFFKLIKETKNTNKDSSFTENNTIKIEGSVTQLLQISLTREQYEQLTESLDNATNFSVDSHDNIGATFDLENNTDGKNDINISLKENSWTFVKFLVPILKIHLKNENNDSLINITFREFSIQYDQNEYEKYIQILLRSVLMEDLKCSLDSKFRNMVDSSTDCNENLKFKSDSCSSSCPNLSKVQVKDKNIYMSMPSKLNYQNLNHTKTTGNKSEKSVSINTPACDEKLVIYKSQTSIVKIPVTEETVITESSIDFNCLNLTISVDRWCMFLDFFGLLCNNETSLIQNSSKDTKTNVVKNISSELKISIRSLNLTLVRDESELSKANISNVFLEITRENVVKVIKGSLGSMSLYDLTKFGNLYYEKFSTEGPEALNFLYRRLNNEDIKKFDDRSLMKDATLRIQMSSVRYIHIKRFLIELQLFIKEILQLQSPVLRRIKRRDIEENSEGKTIKIGLDIHAASPIILLPLCYNSNQVIIADLGEFTLKNNFHFSNDEIIASKKQNSNLPIEIIEVMQIDLININLYAGERLNCHKSLINSEYLNFGNFQILKWGRNLFKETCYLKLQVERNTESNISHNCPDLTIKGTLSKLNGVINLQQYKLIRGFLNYNLGECIDDVYYNYASNICESIEKLSLNNMLTESFKIQIGCIVWNTMSINLQLEDVAIHLAEQLKFENSFEPLACINFIKSSLEIDIFSDGSQDIDLISSEISIVDSRDNSNVFKHILKPTEKDTSKHVVQVEIHSRQRLGSAKYTILLNNMRIMAILDYWESFKNFIQEEPFVPFTNTLPRPNKVSKQVVPKESPHDEENKLEIILNVTDSELVFVENFESVDTNAVILKSTTVISYKPKTNVSISIDINHLEIFSCILGAEDESALSIIDPFALNMELRNSTFQILVQQQLFIRLSYSDVKLFAKLLRSIPKQTKTSQLLLENNIADFEVIAPLITMGFSEKDCWSAMETNNYRLNDAAIWLTQQKQLVSGNGLLEIHNVTLNAHSISLCIIDDCMDSDVPLLEISLVRLMINQNLKYGNAQCVSSESYNLEGSMETVVASDYYNRRLSGWEPIFEPWECSTNWKYIETYLIKNKSLQMNITSKQLLKLNLTTNLIELSNIVRKNWMQDYYGTIQISPLNSLNTNNLSNYRRRIPFVPFALKNFTGEPLLFKTMFSQAGGITQTDLNQHDILCNWIAVQPNEIKPFDFGPRTKLRHMNSHKLNLHQILLQIHGWTLIGPISIDKVGIFFRYATFDLQYKRRTRIVFDISLVGSAQKIIVVRSALNIVNKLDRRLLLRMDFQSDDKTAISIIEPQEHLSIPLKAIESSIHFKPLDMSSKNEKLVNYFTKDQTTLVEKDLFSRSISTESSDDVGFCINGILWMNCTKDPINELYSCYGQNSTVFHTLVEIKRDKFPHRDINLPGHTISLLPPLKLKNLLCCDLFFEISGYINGRIRASKAINIYTVNINNSFNLSITLDNYKLSGQLKIPMGHNGIVEPKLKLIDIFNRELYLRVSIQSFRGKGMEIYISAPVWIINRTGLPLVYRQENCSHSASGQFEENEKARVVSPLLFSFSDKEGSPSLQIRLGNSFGVNNPWCKNFNIHKETIYRELKAEDSKGSFAVGINVNRGRGVYSCTTFVIISPRFQLYNKSSFKLEFSQKCNINEFTTTENVIIALPGCNFPFHWPNFEQEPLLCVRIADLQFCHWSSGIPINEVQSLYINIRNDLGEMYFLRLEVISQEATYILLFSDANTLPPPIRIDNYSEVFINFFQYGCKSHWRTTVRPRSSLAYALDDPMCAQTLQIEAPGGNSVEFHINRSDNSQSITYANFIYIAFKETFISVTSDENVIDVSSQQLVLGVKDKKVIIMKKCSGDRSQLWLMNSNGQLEHEGSSPPAEFGKNQEVKSPRMVLDLEKAPNPKEYTNLVVRPPNKQRMTTQTWRFENGRLMCHANMCVQARNGIYGLRAGCEAVLSRIESKSRITNAKYIPFEQSVEIQKLRPGSGHLEVTSKMDGPIRTIQIFDVKAKKNDDMLTPDPLWNHASINHRKIISNAVNILDECTIQVELYKGLGLSIISRQPFDELTYTTFENIKIDWFSTPFFKSIDFKVSDLQIDNQLVDTSCPVLLHTAKVKDSSSSNSLTIKSKILSSPNENAVIFEYVTLDIKPCTLCLEERLILKIALFLGFGTSDEGSASVESVSDARSKDNLLSKNSKRFYFENLYIGPIQIRLSVFTSSKLTQELLDAKRILGLTLIKFEDALIDFDKFSDKHHFETMDVFLKAIKTHYINQIKWHAASILGSVDFLGNPLGFANDLSEGVSSLIFEGSVKSLVKNVTHGISNSTAKLTETLSDSLGRVVLDEHDNETRQKILEMPLNTSGSHLAAGLKGFGFGLLGGVTSIVRHTYVGAQSDGFPGFLSGLGKGLVGTVTKPIIGVLDLASETASAVRETSKGSHHNLPDRKRLPRCVTGAPGGLLPAYSYRQSRGQQYLYVINRRNFTEKLMFYEPNLCNDRDAKLRLLVSTEYIRIFSRCYEDPAIMLECHLSEVLSCHPITTNAGNTDSASKVIPHYYIEISTNLPKITRPRVRCENEQIAERAARCINYAKSVFDEREQSIVMD